MDWIFTFVRSSDRRRINTICYFAWKSYTASRCIQLAFIPASYCWSCNHCSLSFCGQSNDRGTNFVIASIHANEETPARVAPLIFISTILTQLCGGSAGREGAALQIGGSLGNLLGKIVHLDDEDRHVLIMCGMSAAFAALFGTPMAAAVFSMEMVSVGVMYYSALVPCVMSALIGAHLASTFGVHAENLQL